MLSPISILSAETVGDTDTFAKVLVSLLLLIVFVVVICAHIFISWPFLVTKTIFGDECHTQQRNLKICKVCYKFQTAEVPCYYSAMQWLNDYISHMVCVTVKFAAQQPLMTSESNSRGLADGCWCWPVHCGTTCVITPTTGCECDSINYSWSCH